MKQTISLLFAIGAFLLLCSFTPPLEPNYVGTYGVSENDPSNIELTLSEDHSFTYRDLSNPAKEIRVSGDWEAKNKHILLTNYDSDFSFHCKWKIAKDGMVATSRKGLTFYTLRKQ